MTDQPVLVGLDERTIEALAHRIAELIHDRPAREPGTGRDRLLTAAQVSAWCGVERAWVYEHAEQLGALRLGTGPKPRLRFDPDIVAARLSPATPTPPAQPSPTGARRSPAIAGSFGALLPLRADPELSSPHPDTSRPGGAPTPPATAPKTMPAAR